MVTLKSSNANDRPLGVVSGFSISNFKLGCTQKRGCLGGKIITPRNVGQNSQILRNPLKFAFLTIFGCK